MLKAPKASRCSTRSDVILMRYANAVDDDAKTTEA
jgi:hypothetical protein